MAAKGKWGWGGRRPGAGRKGFLKERRRAAVDLEREDFEALEQIAEREGTSVSAVIREAVRGFLLRRRRK